MTKEPPAHPRLWLHGALVWLAAAGLVACGGGNENPGAPGSGAASTLAKSSTPSGGAADTDSPSTGASGTDDDLPEGLQKSDAGRPLVQPPNTEGRLLASNCFQCHGTLGRGGFDSIRGGEAEEIEEFLTKAANKDIMAAHAQGYTPAQIQKIVAYLQQ